MKTPTLLKRLTLTTALMLGATWGAACGESPPEQPDTPTDSQEACSSLPRDMRERIDSFITERMSQGRVPGLSLAILQDGKPVCVKGYGVANRETGAPMTARTRVSVGSTTKSMTALALMRLVEQGRVDLEAPVTRYLPWFRTADGRQEQLLVKHTLSHATGLPSFTVARSPSDPGALEARVRELSGVSLRFAPGTGFEYSNDGFALAGLIVQTVSGMPYEEYLARDVFQPLGMKDTVFGLEAVPEGGALAQGYAWTRGGLRPDVLLTSRAHHPAGSALYTSAEDVSRYLAALLAHGRTMEGAQVLSMSSVERMWKPEVAVPASFALVAPGSWYGFGWFIEPLHGEQAIRHGGRAGTSGSDFVLFPGKGLAVAVLSNLDTLTKHELAKGVAALLLDASPAASSDVLPSCPSSYYSQVFQPDGSAWRRYTGDYVIQGTPARVYTEGGRLLMELHTLKPAQLLELEPYGDNAFLVRDDFGGYECTPVSFMPTPDGGMGVLVSGAPAGVRLPE